MRLSSVLSDAITYRLVEVEPFMGKSTARWGAHRKIEAGTVTRTYFCSSCLASRPFNSKKQLNGLVAGPNLVSIDVVLKCVDCPNAVENWFLVRCADDLFGAAPSVSLIQFAEHLGDAATTTGQYGNQLQDLLNRADLARRHGLAAGSIVYLRKFYEIVTHAAANSCGVELRTLRDKRRSFADILKEVNDKISIIPAEFSEHGYQLFSELSEAIHGEADEETSLSKFDAMRRLVLGVFENVRNRDEFAQARSELGWLKEGAA